MDRRLTGRLQVGIFAAAVGQASGSGAAELPCPPVCGRQRSAAALAEGPATGVPERGSGPGAAHMPAATAAGRSEQMTRPAGPVPGTGVGADSISRPARQVHLAVLMAFAATGQPPSPAEIERLIRAGGGEPDGDVGHAQMPGHHPRSRARHRPGHHRRGRRRPGPVDAPVRGRVRRPGWRCRLPVRGRLLRVHQLFHHGPDGSVLGPPPSRDRRQDPAPRRGAPHWHRPVRRLAAASRRPRSPPEH